MSIQTITAEQASQLVRQGAMLIDIRDADEHARERIPQSYPIPVAEIGRTPLPEGTSTVIFHCRSGNRTVVNAAKLRASTGCEAYVLEGGLDAWKRAGLPVVTDRGQPLELMRQVQIWAGTLVLLGVILGATVSAAFYLLAGFVGAGLVFAGVTGTCGMARFLQLMPWNRRMAA
ncbi:MAG TPA: rhodanese family protein [Povalibacter sp.]|nr:rhodanese family protein [Povalibacter sp.]